MKIPAHVLVSPRRAAGLLLAIGCGVAVWQASERRPTGAACGTELPTVSQTASESDVPVESGGYTPSRAASNSLGTTLRIGTYNVHGCKGIDRKIDVGRIVEVMRGVDLVGLNEVRDSGWFSSQPQAQSLGEGLGLPWLFAPTTRQWGKECFGNGALCRCPVLYWNRVPLPAKRPGHYRNAVLLSLSGPRPLQVLITHVDRRSDREVQLAAVTALFLSMAEPSVLLGDLNATADDPLLARLLKAPGVNDVLRARLPQDSPDRIDWILARGLHCVRAGMVSSIGSDHPHYWGEFDWPVLPPQVRHALSKVP